MLVALGAVAAVALVVTQGGGSPDEKVPGESSRGTEPTATPSPGIPTVIPTQLPSELPSLPSELPSELPTGLPTEWPTELPGVLPSGFVPLFSSPFGGS